MECYGVVGSVSVRGKVSKVFRVYTEEEFRILEDFIKLLAEFLLERFFCFVRFCLRLCILCRIFFREFFFLFCHCRILPFPLAVSCLKEILEVPDRSDPEAKKVHGLALLLGTYGPVGRKLKFYRRKGLYRSHVAQCRCKDYCLVGIPAVCL